MVTRDMLKAEIDLIREEHLEILYRILKAFETREGQVSSVVDWKSFVEETYGSLSTAPIIREQQGTYEKRDTLK